MVSKFFFNCQLTNIVRAPNNMIYIYIYIPLKDKKEKREHYMIRFTYHNGKKKSKQSLPF